MGIISVVVVNLKKIVFLVFCLIGLPLLTFANTTPDDKPIVNCPKEIQCMVNGKIDKCYVSEDPYGIWSSGQTANYGRVIKGIYKFKKAFSFNYQYGYMTANKKVAKGASTEIYDTCQYSNTDSLGVERLIGLSTRLTFIEPFLNLTNQWSVVGISGDGYESSCLSFDPQLCPFVELPVISYISEKNKYGFFKHYYDELNPNYYSNPIFYNQLLSNCGATSLCRIDVAISTDQSSGSAGGKINIGTITVDITKPDFVKIVNIDNVSSSDCILKKKEPFNAIYCEPKKKTSVVNQ